MKIKNYLFQLTVAIAAFVFGVGCLTFGQYWQIVYKTKENQVVLVQTKSIEETAYTKRTSDQSPLNVSEQTDTYNNSVEFEKKEEFEFDGNGNYYVDRNLRKGFEDFYGISIRTRDVKIESEGLYEEFPIPPEGYAETKMDFKMTSIGIANKQ